ncbi:hypothetical protein LSTR_LSTR014696 [Laodelphax striatellus]|uniref:Uncharacterized protein n=1 Tax=Laodelphax striatellus TaxID=195883 RepID=A0A482XNE7_LAOST|nr:hypothetical protein LSTR_LSTR014696 [Laodelphax striatellus]
MTVIRLARRSDTYVNAGSNFWVPADGSAPMMAAGRPKEYLFVVTKSVMQQITFKLNRVSLHLKERSNHSCNVTRMNASLCN